MVALKENVDQFSSVVIAYSKTDIVNMKLALSSIWTIKFIANTEGPIFVSIFPVLPNSFIYLTNI